jgi:flagellin-specific chaperone FliS
MSRLNRKAWKILRAEVEKCAASDRIAGEAARNIALKRLEQMRCQKGKPVSEEELRQEIAALFPNFSARAIKAAVKADRSPGLLAIVPLAAAGLAGCAGLIWILNLPYPMIRRPVARMAPIVLLPSYLNMDRNYREAIANVEQAEQLIDKQNYQQAATPADRQKAIAAWQTAMDELAQLPSATLAGQMAGTKLDAYYRDFQQVSGLVAGSDRADTMINGARQFAAKAAEICQNPPHSAARWQQCYGLWQQAIDRRESISADDLGYLEAQTLLATYQTNLGNIEIRRQSEARSVEALEAARREIEQLKASMPKDGNSLDRNYVIAQLQKIINRLELVQPGTTAYSQAQELLASARQKQKQLD